MKHKLTILLFVTLLLTAGILSANEGSVSVKLGYIAPDESDNLGVNQETYNLYEGLGLSFNDLRYRFDNGLLVNGDFNNVTLNNRNLRMSVLKPKLFSLSFYNNQYRRTYDADGVYFTRRISTGVSGQITPTENFKLFGGFSSIDKDGNIQEVFQPFDETFSYKTDFSQYTYNFGSEGFCPFGRLRVEYKHHFLQDDINYNDDRKMNQFSVTAFTSIPGHRNYTLAGGLTTRKDEYYDLTSALKTNSFWGATKLYFKNDITFNYRLVSSKFEDTDNSVETKHMDHTVTLTKTWPRQGGITGGFEYRTADNDVDKTTAKGYLVSGWYHYNKHWQVRGKYSFIGKDVDEGATLVGNEDRTRHNITVNYTGNNWGSLQAKVEKRIKKYDDISSKADYTTLSGRALLQQAEFGKLVLSYTYYRGKYENHSDDVSYDFKNHVLSADFYPIAFGKTQLKIGGTYYRGDRDDTIYLEKFNGNVGLSVELPQGYLLEGTYRLYTFDDYTMINNTYTGNIFEINFIKNIQL